MAVRSGTTVFATLVSWIFFFSFNNFFFHSISSSRRQKTSILSYLLFYEISVVHFFLQLFFIGITKQAYYKAVWAGADLSWRCLACRGSEGAESSTISEQSMDKQVASELHNELTIYDAPAQSTTVSLKPQGEIWTLFINSTTLLLSLGRYFKGNIETWTDIIHDIHSC